MQVGELVSLHASINYVGNSSLIVGIRVEALDVRTSIVKHTNSSYFTMVAKGDDNKPTMVPKLILESREDVKRFLEAMRLKEIRSKVREEMDDTKSHVDIDNAKSILKSERCIINYTI